MRMSVGEEQGASCHDVFVTLITDMVAPMFYISELKTTVSQFGSASFEAENECHDVEAGGCRDRPEATAGNVAEATRAQQEVTTPKIPLKGAGQQNLSRSDLQGDHHH